MSSPTQRQSDESIDRVLTVLTTEHYTLQMIRGSTIFEASNRAGQYFAMLSAILIALGLIAQVAPERVLLGVSCGLFSGVYVIGLVTAARAMESSLQDIQCGIGINRIRHFYQEAAPSAAPYFVMSSHDDLHSVLSDGGEAIWSGGRRPSPLGPFLTVAGLINLVNGWILGVAIAEAAILSGLGMLAALAAGLFGAVASIGALALHQQRTWSRGVSAIETRFPPEAGRRQHADPSEEGER
jgi:hypothetical protein